MKLTLTTLVIIEDTSDNCNEMSLCYHSFQEDPNRAKSEIIAAVNGVYAPDRVYMNQYTDIRILTNEIEPC